MTDHKLEINEDVASATDQVNATTAEMVRAKVTAEDGIFKAGKLHKEGSEVVITRQSAENFESVGEVEILGSVENE